MFGGNPNRPRDPYAGRYPQMAKPMQQGGKNPYGFGYERIAGKLALQRNVPGMPTNTMPLPSMHSPYQQRPRPPYRMNLGGY